MPNNRLAGIINLEINGEVFDLAGDFTYNPGANKREALLGPGRVDGYKSAPQVPFIEGTIRDSRDLDVKALLELKDVTVTLTLANDKTVMVRDAWQAAEGDVGTAEADIQVRFEGKSFEEVKPS